MDLRYANRGNACELHLSGKLDLDSAEGFESGFQTLLSEITAPEIGINLSKLDYIDSSGLGSLIKALNMAKKEGKSMLLFAASPKIQQIFAIARLDKFFQFIRQEEFDAKYPEG